ncbi:polynucleotide kinase-phosphatase [Phaeodactylibacter sp.]|uniref:polynucleotide kinase-phosphatase n=1 Tax=Phaeodactylibacter sp. TaxID=1940289 RepID=UPI00260150CB|nr:polynucleotide kinase-phosphatase [Phaeodactylibacter sp.]MCI4649812.1 polynucleotide kinase-phosphatase [Phaeodactylibacter sp.]MCI5092228.1 polynucleotide kinase-phosphatase [Phaeodactylibacter sp.]
MTIEIPELCLVILLGSSSAGKSTFAKRHFQPTEVVSSDACRAMVADDETAKNANSDAFDLVHFIVEKRLKRGLLTVVDATNLQPEGRSKLVAIAQRYHVFAIAIALNVPEAVLLERNAAGRQLPARVIRNHHRDLKRSMRKLKKEGIRKWYELKETSTIDAAQVLRKPVWNNKKHLHGPFDLIGDVHGCYTELRELLTKLGYRITQHRDRNRGHYGYTVKAPEGRTAVFVGDLVDRGPASNEVLRLVMSMHESGAALCVAGNHDDKLQRKLDGRQVQLKHGLAETMDQLASEPPAFIAAARTFLRGLISHYVLDDGKLVVAHAGLREEMHGRTSKTVRAFCLYGETTGETDEFGLPVRYEWAREYRGEAVVVFGHTPVPRAVWLNNTINIDTGCVFGHELTALRYPERKVCSVPAREQYAKPARPMHELSEAEEAPLPSLQDFMGRRSLHTKLRDHITIREENGLAALETMSRFAVNPRWLVYLPPTMSPSETSHREGFLEHPDEAMDYYRKNGVGRVICQEKHMGSRAIVVIGKDEGVIARRFGIKGEGTGCIYTRTGRAFFKEKATEQALLERLNAALEKAGLWQELNTDWLVLDCELMPWSAKAQQLLKEQYAAVGAAGTQALLSLKPFLRQAVERGLPVEKLEAAVAEKAAQVEKFRIAYRSYCWTVDSLEDYRLAPFHIMAGAEHVYTDQPHSWHMETLGRLADSDSVLHPTAYRIVNLEETTERKAATEWWLDLTEKGGEGMVIKPLDFLAYGKNGLLQPAVKCRGREYLRIIYGPAYTDPEKLAELRKRGLAHKRSMALRELALGIEGLERFVHHEPFNRIHECALGVLALESEPVDPRL